MWPLVEPITHHVPDLAQAHDVQIVSKEANDCLERLATIQDDFAAAPLQVIAPPRRGPAGRAVSERVCLVLTTVGS